MITIISKSSHTKLMTDEFNKIKGRYAFTGKHEEEKKRHIIFVRSSSESSLMLIYSR